MKPFLQISIVSTLEKEWSNKHILSLIKDRFERTHKISACWIETDDSVMFELLYPSETRFFECYQMGYDVFNKLAEKLSSGNNQLNDIFIDAMNAKHSQTDYPLCENYLVLKYRTNTKKPMRESYQFVGNIVKLFGVAFSIEEVEDGFLFFYLHKDDFLGFQIDPTNYKEVRDWIQYLDLDYEDEKIQKLLGFIKNID